MARSALFARLAQLLHTGQGCEHRARPPQFSGSRRELLALSALGSAGLLASCAYGKLAKTTHAPRIAIVGAGMAGLSCAYRLAQAGVKATVFEASARVGGRMFSARGRFRDGQVGELGGEFIDSNHAHMHALKHELAIELDDRERELVPGVARDIWWVAGKRVEDSLLSAQYARVVGSFRELVARSEREPELLAELDHTPLSAFLAHWLADAEELRRVIETAYRGEYGRELETQSALNLLYLIGLESAAPLQMFGSSDERFHARDGNETFPERLAAKLTDSIEREHVLRAVRGSAERGYTLMFERATSLREVQADVVVFALPFTLLREVELEQLPLSAEKRALIAELGYGTNAKLLGAFRERVWFSEQRASGSVSSDEPWQQCWDTSLGQRGAGGLITNFLGGKAGERIIEGTPEARYDELVHGLERVFPGVRARYVAGSAVRMHWPSHPFSKGSYSCYAPGQWARHGHEGLPEARESLHFCGEHTSLDHQGFMEGAAETGALSAAAILRRLGVAPNPLHAAALHTSLLVPQPALGQLPKPGSFARRSSLRRRVLAARTLRRAT